MLCLASALKTLVPKSLLRKFPGAMAVAIVTLFQTVGAQASTFTTVYSFHSPEKRPTGGLVLAGDGNFYGTTAYGGSYNSGTFLRMTPGGAVTPLATFNGTNGTGPQAALVIAGDGNFYGTTYGGGTFGKGTIFRVTPSGLITSLYSFAGGSDGGNPWSALAIGRDGNFYGTAQVGGTANVGTAFRLTPGGSFTLLHTFQNVTNDGAYPNGLTLGSDGNLYGTTYWGGPAFYGTVYQLTPAGGYTLLYSFSGVSDGGNPITSLTLAKDGNFYGTTVGVGSGNFGTVFKITPGGALTTLYSFTGGADGAYVAAPLVQGGDGNFYGIASLGGKGADGTIFRVTPAGVLTTLHQFTGFGVSGNVPFLANLGGLVEGTDGNFYGCVPQFYNAALNPNDGSLFRITPSGTFSELVSFITLNGENPLGVFLGQDGNLYGSAAEGGMRNDGTLFRVTPQGSLTTLTTFNGANGILPTVIVQGKNGDVYGAAGGGNTNPGRLFRRTSAGKLVWQVLFDGTDGAVPYAALFGASDGNFYGTTSAGGTSFSGNIFRVTPAGVLTNLYSFTGGADGATPLGPLIQDKQGNLYGTTYLGGSSQSGTVFKITMSGAFSSLYSFTGGTDGGFPPVGLTLGDDGNLYGVTLAGGSDFGGTVFQITPAGAFTSLYSFSYFSGGSLPFSALVKGANGVFYGSTLLGGTYGYGTLYSSPTTGNVTFVYSFTGGADGGQPASLSAGAGGSFYGTTTLTTFSSSNPGTIFQFTP